MNIIAKLVAALSILGCFALGWVLSDTTPRILVAAGLGIVYMHGLVFILEGVEWVLRKTVGNGS